MQICTVLTRSYCKNSDIQVTVKACGPLVTYDMFFNNCWYQNYSHYSVLNLPYRQNLTWNYWLLLGVEYIISSQSQTQVYLCYNIVSKNFKTVDSYWQPTAKQCSYLLQCIFVLSIENDYSIQGLMKLFLKYQWKRFYSNFWANYWVSFGKKLLNDYEKLFQLYCDSLKSF